MELYENEIINKACAGRCDRNNEYNRSAHSGSSLHILGYTEERTYTKKLAQNNIIYKC